MRQAPQVVNRHGTPVQSVKEWGARAGPASKDHWKEGRSAKELAKAWITGDGSAALTRLLDTRTETTGLVIEYAVAEAQVAFDSFRGGKRNHDLLIRGRAAGGSIVIGLEGKADETFGETVRTYFEKSKTKSEGDKRTNAPARLAGLMDDIAGTSLAATPTLGSLRYQLFSAVAGTLAAVKDDETAAFIVHEFATAMTTAKKRQANKKALAALRRSPESSCPTTTGG